MKTLKQLRVENGLTQSDLARLSGGEWRNTIFTLESGKQSPTLRRLRELLALMGYSLKLEIEKDGRVHFLDLDSLMGSTSTTRAKDTRDEEHIPKAETVQKGQPEGSQDLPDQGLQSLLTDILTK